MNHKHLTILCNEFEIGAPSSSPKRVHGGLLHMMLRIPTMWITDSERCGSIVSSSI